MLFIGFAIYQNQVGRFLRDWSPVALMFLIYGIALELVEVVACRSGTRRRPTPTA